MNNSDQAAPPDGPASASAPASSAIPTGPRRFWLLTLLSAAGAAVINACKAPSSTPPAPEAILEASPTGVIGPVAGASGSARASSATSAKSYRQDAASHLYGLNADRIYKGKLPPLLYAVGTLNVEIDRVGRVTSLNWLRAPRHAPEVIKDIEAMVGRATPFPAPARLGKVTYTDTWLWHKSGQFQLDTLTEGQS